jgi:hypothetical protein
MMTRERADILRLLAEISDLTPDVRFGQLIANLSYLALGPKTESIWEMEDADLFQALKRHLADLTRSAREVA